MTKPSLSTLLLVIGLLAGCSGQPRPDAVSSKQASRVPRDFSPHILTVSPEAVPFSDNRVALGTFHITYQIDGPELVDKASLELFSNALLIAYADIPVAPRGEADLRVDRSVEIGPVVKLEVRCPTGDSNWLAVGALRPPASKALPRIENITPDSIPSQTPQELAMGTGRADAPFDLSLWGSGFSPECKARYSVNDGEPIEAYTAFRGKQQIIAQVTRRPLYPFSWSHKRYLDLLLVLDGKTANMRKADARAIPTAAP